MIAPRRAVALLVPLYLAGPPPAAWAAQAPPAVQPDTLCPAAAVPPSSGCPILLDGLVATVTRVGIRAVAPGVRVEVVEGAALREGGAAELASALADRTGIELEGGHPVGAGVMVQGMDGRRVLVLVDGKPLVGRLSGVQDLSRIPLSAVDRVEVVRGPQAALYGSEALGGVVNILTRRGGERPLEVSVGMVAGSAGRLEGQVETRGRVAGVGYLAGAGRRQDDLVPGLQSPDGGTVRHDLRLRLEGEGPVRWEAGGLLLSDELDWRTGQLVNLSRGTQWTGRLRGAGELGEGHWAAGASMAGFRQRSGRASGSVDPGTVRGNVQKEERWDAELVAAHPLPFARMELEAGVELHGTRITADRVEGGVQDETGVEVFAQGSLALGRVTLIPAIRRSARTGADAHWIPELAARVPVSSWGSLVLRAAGGYRVADLKERSLTFLNVGPGFGYQVRGNPGLQPEHSTHLGADFQWRRDDLSWGLRVFHNAYRDFIETELVGDSAGVALYRYRNAARGRTSGVEAELGGAFGPLEWEGGAGLLSARDTGRDRPLLGRAPWTARMSLTAPGLPLGLRGRIAVVHTGATPIRHLEPEEGAAGESRAETPNRDAFSRVDLGLSRVLPRGMSVAVGVVNLLDARPDSWPSSPERRIHLTFSAGPLSGG